MLPLPPRDSASIGDGFALKAGEQGIENETPLETVSWPCSTARSRRCGPELTGEEDNRYRVPNGRVEGYLVGLNSGDC